MKKKRISLKEIKARFDAGYFTGQNSLDVDELLKLIAEKNKEISKLKIEKQILQSTMMRF